MFLTGFFISVFLISGCEQQSSGFVAFAGETMGTSYHVKISTDSTEEMTASLKGDVDKLLLEVNQAFSTYISDSEVSLLNKSFDTAPQVKSSAFINVTKEALSISEITQGAYDITIGPIVNLWGFGPDFTKENKPSDEKIQKALATVGYKNIQVDTENKTVRKTNPAIYIDFSSIAKGYGVDAVAELMESKGYQNYMVEIGGEMRVSGVNSEGGKWRIAVEKPDPAGRAIHRIINVSNTAIATSGDYRNFFEEDGVRFSHTLNPKTGLPVQHTLSAVTVLSENSMTADAWATAFMVLGAKTGYDLAMNNELAVLFLTSENGVIKEKMTPYFQRITEER